MKNKVSPRGLRECCCQHNGAFTEISQWVSYLFITVIETPSVERYLHSSAKLARDRICHRQPMATWPSVPRIKS